jgi:DNA primase large subunit
MSEFEKELNKYAERFMISENVDQGVSKESFKAGAEWAYDFLQGKTHFDQAINNGQKYLKLKQQVDMLAEALEQVVKNKVISSIAINETLDYLENTLAEVKEMQK